MTLLACFPLEPLATTPLLLLGSTQVTQGCLKQWSIFSKFKVDALNERLKIKSPPLDVLSSAKTTNSNQCARLTKKRLKQSTLEWAPRRLKSISQFDYCVLVRVSVCDRLQLVGLINFGTLDTVHP